MSTMESLGVSEHTMHAVHPQSGGVSWCLADGYGNEISAACYYSYTQLGLMLLIAYWNMPGS